MRLSLSQQYIDNLKLIGLDLNMILELANLPDTTWKEEMNLSTLDYYHLLMAFDKVANDRYEPYQGYSDVHAPFLCGTFVEKWSRSDGAFCQIQENHRSHCR